MNSLLCWFTVTEKVELPKTLFLFPANLSSWYTSNRIIVLQFHRSNTIRCIEIRHRLPNCRRLLNNWLFPKSPAPWRFDGLLINISRGKINYRLMTMPYNVSASPWNTPANLHATWKTFREIFPQRTINKRDNFENSFQE